MGVRSAAPQRAARLDCDSGCRAIRVETCHARDVDVSSFRAWRVVRVASATVVRPKTSMNILIGSGYPSSWKTNRLYEYREVHTFRRSVRAKPRLRLGSFSRAWKSLRRAGTGTRTRRWAPIRCGKLCSASDALRLQWWPHESISDATTSELRKVRFHCLLRSRLHRCIPCHCPPATSASAAATSGSASLAASASLAGGGERCCTGRAARQLSARREGPLSAPPPSALELS